MTLAFLVALAMLAGGTGLLLKGADWFTDGATDLARTLGVSALFIGVVLAGLEPEEMVTAAIASGRGAGALALGDIVGTNITIVLAALGLAALMVPLTIERGVRVQAVIATLASIPPILLLYTGVISRLAGALLLLLFAVYTVILLRADRQALARQAAAEQLEHDDDEQEHEEQNDSAGRGAVGGAVAARTLGGLIAMAVGGPVLVEGALRLTDALDLRQASVGLTIVAFGTGAEMLALAVVAARRKQADILVGGILGSLAYNLLVTLGLAAVVRPLLVDPDLLRVAVPVMMVAHLLLLGVVWRRHMGRLLGACFLTGYAAYVVAVLWRG
jgi:cation:H+ antiporter